MSETKGHAFALMDRLRAKGVKLAGIKINMSGCPSSCAKDLLGDIGLKGVRVRRKAGTCDGFDVFLGGGVHETVELAILYRKGVDTDQLPELIEDWSASYDREHRRSTRRSASSGGSRLNHDSALPVRDGRG